VGVTWFDRYTVPLALILVLLSGIGPVIAWRRATLANARRNFLLPLAAAALMAIAAYTVVPIGSSFGAVVLFCGAVFVFASIGQEFWRGWRARRAMSSESPPVALYSMVRRNRRRYGGYIVHVGIAVLFSGLLDVPARAAVEPARGAVRARRRLHDEVRAGDRVGRR
jgi:cytochrome c-type biogenesis protein CcmF